MSADLSVRIPRPLLAVLLALVCAAALLVAWPEDEAPWQEDDAPEAAACAGRQIESWEPEQRVTDEFARYGNDGLLTDDWTGGDGTHSVRLPDGRVLWLFSDTFLGPVGLPPNLLGQRHHWRSAETPLLRNSAVLAAADGRLERTLPAPLFPDPAPDQWRWPVAARVEARAPGSAEQVVRVLLWTRAKSDGPWIYGVPVATEVATLRLPDLALEGFNRISDLSRVADPRERVQYGTTAVSHDGYTYVFGGNDGAIPDRPTAKLHVARVPEGRLGDLRAWRYWDGEDWGGKAVPVLGDGRNRGVSSAFSVVRQGDTWVLITMAAGPKGLTDVTSYWACAPQGPWYGPGKELRPPLPRDEGPAEDAAAYNPQVQEALGGGPGVVISYDVNWLSKQPAEATAALSRNVDLYRPRFLRVQFGPAEK
ncbi:DUF4185 domain-containing protein [Streptomyces sp. NPDC060194]|uniref:DUF4185 domain-containing protein n=1 Tax=Streptomyces sp. NPDC060194 TaxID=3347069 RepID=UPI0036523280